MFCNKCGNEVEQNQEFCNKCGNRLIYNAPMNEEENNINYNENYNYNYNNNINKRNIAIPILITILIIVLIIGVFVYIIISNNNKNNYYFSESNIETTDTGQTPVVQAGTNSSSKTGKYSTAIITDNVYSGISVKNVDDARKLINQDSINQKKNDYPKEIMDIENEIISKYSITAVNLKEMDVEFAKELESVIKKIYEDYPGARGYLTNLTLTNLDMSQSGVIALFMPIFTFGTSNTSTTRPWVIKTQVQLNAKYFLNPERIDVAVETSSKAGHFPKNATKYSPVAHEFGHYLSFIALLNHYSTNSILVIEDNQLQNYYDIYKDFGNGTFSKKMLDEAYQNYLSSNPNIGFDEWRGQISEYALAKDATGDYIYDETVAEAFHDVYLNGNKANIASKYIVEVLKKYIGG